jgi:NAD-dependent oxidoreductase involved in siderophore biosynthesis
MLKSPSLNPIRHFIIIGRTLVKLQRSFVDSPLALNVQATLIDGEPGNETTIHRRIMLSYQEKKTY